MLRPFVFFFLHVSSAQSVSLLLARAIERSFDGGVRAGRRARVSAVATTSGERGGWTHARVRMREDEGETVRMLGTYYRDEMLL